MEVITNNHDRQFSYRTEVPAKVLESEFDWLSEDDGIDGFFRYHGQWYHLSEFERSAAMPGYHAVHCDTYSSGCAGDGSAGRLGRDRSRGLEDGQRDGVGADRRVTVRAPAETGANRRF